MLNVAVAVAGGHLLRETLDQVQVPQLRQNPGQIACKLFVRVLSASLPGLPEPGVLSRSRPYLEVSLGSVQKDTEPADFSPSSSSSKEEIESPWRFDEMLTFTVKVEDLLGPGLKLRLRVLNETQLGPFQFQGRPADVGEATLELQRRILPSCLQQPLESDKRRCVWTSPLMPVPLAHMRGGILGAECKLGQAVAHVTLRFTVDTDPDYLLDLVRPQTLNLEQKLRDSADEMSRWIESLPAPPSCCCQPSFDQVDPLDVDAVVGRAALRAWTVADVQKPLPAPDLSPENWVSTVGPNGRRYWHNLALGPAPWEESEASPSSPGLPSPEEVPSGWIYREGADGRRFWHHADLGPPPWELPTAQASEGPANGGGQFEEFSRGSARGLPRSLGSPQVGPGVRIRASVRSREKRRAAGTSTRNAEHASAWRPAAAWQLGCCFQCRLEKGVQARPMGTAAAAARKLACQSPTSATTLASLLLGAPVSCSTDRAGGILFARHGSDGVASRIQDVRHACFMLGEAETRRI
eukprot:s7308_g2.t2